MKNYKDLTTRYLKANKKRTVLTIVGITLSVALICAIGALLESLNDRKLNDVMKDKGNYHAVFNNIEGKNIDKIKNSVEIEASGVSARVGASPIDISNSTYLNIKAYDENTFDIYNIDLVKGTFPNKSDEIIVSENALNIMKKSVGDTVELAIGEKYHGENGALLGDNVYSDNIVFKEKMKKTYTIVGAIKKALRDGPYNYRAITGMDSVQSTSSDLYNITVRVKKPKETYKIVKNIAEKLNLPKTKKDNMNMPYDIDINEGLMKLIGGSKEEGFNDARLGILAIIIGLVVISTIATIYNAFNISVMERKKEFGILRSIGTTPSQIRSMVLREGTIMTAIAMPIGIFLGIFGLKLVMWLIGLIVTSEASSSIFSLKIIVTPRLIIITVILSIITIILSTYLPAKGASKVSPMEAIRSSKDIKVGKIKKSSLSAKLFKAEGMLASKNIRRNKKKFRVTVFSITISVVLFIVFNGFISLNQVTSEFYTEYKPDYALSSSTSKVLSYSHNEVNAIKSFKGVKKVIYRKGQYSLLIPEESKLNKDVDYRGVTHEGKVKLTNSGIFSPGEDGLKEIKENLAKGKLDKEEMDRVNGVIILQTNLESDNSGKRKYIDYTKYEVGDYITFSDISHKEANNSKEKMPEHKVKVVGILNKPISGYEYPRNGVLMLTTDQVIDKLQLEDGKNITSICIEASDEEDPALKAYLKDLAGSKNGYLMDAKEDAKSDREFTLVMKIFLYGFVVVISLISAINIINTITTNVLLRKRELSMLQAVGMTTKSMHKSIYLEAIFSSFIAWIYGSVIGTVISYALYGRARQAVEFSWTMPLEAVVIALVGTIVVSLIAGTIPINKLKKENIIENIRKESV